ncbi:AraC family transcriptional regulator [Martelella lutilitoris]|uniref:AraC family transcriptional regulator n=1 Tax=Martelella lutilitoris TaxID=2583532 RepID=A0A5C4JSL3_9HYPH|nr:AraC family transcriptional regulator [Martelella lutilitoris]TNB48164.1 AraC family transcriptional regulator [Martelella lutilitoris]
MTDTLTTLFNLLDLRSARCTRFEAGGDWSLRFPEKSAIKFAAVLKGTCFMLHGDRPPIRLRAGDVFLLSQYPSYVLASDPALPPEDGARVIDWTQSDTGRYGGDEVVMIGGAYRASPLHAHLLGDALPPLMLIPAQAPSAAQISRTLQSLESEFTRTDIGAEMMRRHLTDMLLVQMLRAISAREGETTAVPGQSNWIGALTDRRLGAALDAIHANPERNWTVAALAGIAGMSRTAFSQGFRKAIGRAPIDYVLRWRMQVAEDLIHRGRSVSEVAGLLGYGSQSAFGVAFKRIKGRSPRAALRGQAARRA